MNDELLHAAFELVALGRDAVTAKKSLREQFPETDFRTLTEAYAAASSLSQDAYAVADGARKGGWTKSQSLTKLREQCPGFSDQTYERAFSQGLFETR